MTKELAVLDKKCFELDEILHDDRAKQYIQEYQKIFYIYQQTKSYAS